MSEAAYLKTRFPRREWEQTCSGKWASRPVSAETKAARAAILSQLAGEPVEYRPHDTTEDET